MTTLSLRIKSNFISNGRVYHVFDIEKGGIEGDPERIIHYRPYFKDSGTNTLVCSIPEQNLSHINARDPIPQMEMFKLLGSLSDKSDAYPEITAFDAKRILESNNIHEIVQLLRNYWSTSRKSKKGQPLKAKEEIIRTSMKYLLEECALLSNTSLETARVKILSALGE